MRTPERSVDLTQVTEWEDGAVRSKLDSLAAEEPEAREEEATEAEEEDPDPGEAAGDTAGDPVALLCSRLSASACAAAAAAESRTTSSKKRAESNVSTPLASFRSKSLHRTSADASGLGHAGHRLRSIAAGR